VAVAAVALTPAAADAYGAAHVGYTHVGPNGVYHTGATAGPNGYHTSTGYHSTNPYGANYHYGATSTPYGGGYHYGATGYGGAGYGYGGYHYSTGYGTGGGYHYSYVR
jgi:hypothetical protein